MDGKGSRRTDSHSRKQQPGSHPTPQYTFTYSGVNDNNNHSLHNKQHYDYDTTYKHKPTQQQQTTKMSSTENIHAAGSDNNVNIVGARGDHKTSNSFKNANNNHPNTNNNGGDSSPDSNAADLIKTTPPGHTCCQRRCLYWLMASTLVASVLLIAALTFDWVNIVNRYDTCTSQLPGGSKSLAEQNKYKLFATKTTYRHGLDELVKSRVGQRMKHLFGDNSKSLAQLVAGLQGQGCQTKQFHYFGRHAARWPSERDWAKMNQRIREVQARIDLSKLGHDATTSHSERQLNRQQNPVNDNIQLINHANKDNQAIPNETAATPQPTTCFDPLVSYKQWRMSDVLGDESSADLITRTGLAETREIALRYKSLFPNLFDASKVTDLDFGVTEKIRTQQTALVFMKNIDEFKLDSTCKLDQFPSIDDLSGDIRQANSGSSQVSNVSLSRDIEIASRIRKDACFKELAKKYRKDDLLYFHDQCDDFNKERIRPRIPHDYQLRDKDPSRTEFIAKSVSKKLKLNESETLDTNQTKALYDACRYETAISGSSIWCSLFSEEELKFYEYLNDIDDFFRTAYGYEGISKPACVIGTNLFHAFNRALDTNRTESNFYFTHSEVIQRLLALSTSLDNDETYSPVRVKDYLDSKRVPDDREWKNALLSPFSANIAFGVFQCPKDPNGKEGANIKILAALNEQPIHLKGCRDIVCKFNQLRDIGRLLKEKDCKKLEDYCEKEEHVFT